MPVEPMWESEPPESLTCLPRLVGIEGYERLFVRPTERVFNEAKIWAVERGLLRKDASELDDFYFHARFVAVEMALQLGYALALTQPRLGTFEGWLQDAIRAANLAGYQPDIRDFIFDKEETVTTDKE